MAIVERIILTPQHQQFYQDNGYLIVSGLFSGDEVAGYREHYMALRQSGPFPGDTAGVDIGGDDPIKKYPRMIHMHRWDEISLRWLVDPRLNACMTGLLGREPYAVQTMLYFKPPRARGQALHQDQFYLRVQPGTCMAAWMALDACDEANGCLQVVPGSHKWPVLCTEKADTTVSFTDVTVPLPPGQEVRPVIMGAGDLLFFHGSLVHGSFPNTTTDRFRRALIGHYIDGAAEQVAEFYQPALRMNGQPLELTVSPGGGTCGVWVDREGAPVIEMSGDERTRRKHE
jgi:phytanoyl-CoA hydroxylase